MISEWITVDHEKYTVSYSFELDKKDPLEYERLKNNFYARAFTNLNNANKWASDWNNSLPVYIKNHVQTLKKKYEEEDAFFRAINVKIDTGTKEIFTAPTVKKIVVPQPRANDNGEFTLEPSMANEMYEDTLKVLYDAGKSMERKPSLYIGKDEEAIRDQFLFLLETRYAGVTASGETFNKGGKTDILLRYAKDGSNLFVAECKFWHGASEFHKAIKQLFDRYLTWRDSKTALILFVKGREFSDVLSVVKLEARKNEYFVKEAGQKGESSFSYLFRLPQDTQKHVYLEIMAFHYDKEV